MHEAYVQRNFAWDGVDIYISEGGQGARYLLKADGTMEQMEPHAVVTSPTIRLPEPAARALLDQLLKFFEGATDLHTVRSDLLHERDQRDKLQDAITRIAEAATA